MFNTRYHRTFPTYRLFVETPPGPPGCLAGVPLAGPSVRSEWPFGYGYDSLEFFPTHPVNDPARIPGREPSGLVYIPDFERIFVVDDENVLLPMSRDLVADERGGSGGSTTGVAVGRPTGLVGRGGSCPWYGPAGSAFGGGT